MRVLGAPLALLVDALSYLVSATLIWRIRAHEAPPERADAAMSLRAEIGQGLRAVWQSPVLRALALSSTVMNVAGFLFLSIYVLYMTRDLGLGAEAVGLVFAAGGVGALLGSVSAGPARGRWGVGRVLLGSQILFGLFGMLVPLAVLFPDAALPLVVAAEFLQWVMVLVFSVNSVSLRQAITPDRLLGRVNGTMRFIVWGSRPIGSLLGGYLGSRVGLPATLVVGAFGMLIAFVPLLASPIPQLRHLAWSNSLTTMLSRRYSMQCSRAGYCIPGELTIPCAHPQGIRPFDTRRRCGHGWTAVRRGGPFVGDSANTARHDFAAWLPLPVP